MTTNDRIADALERISELLSVLTPIIATHYVNGTTNGGRAVRTDVPSRATVDKVFEIVHTFEAGGHDGNSVPLWTEPIDPAFDEKWDE